MLWSHAVVHIAPIFVVSVLSSSFTSASSFYFSSFLTLCLHFRLQYPIRVWYCLVLLLLFLSIESHLLQCRITFLLTPM